MSKTCQETVRELLEDAYPGRVYCVEDGQVWVSGMNQNCTGVAHSMALELMAHGVPAGLVHDDSAGRFGGVQFNYGRNA